VIAETLRRSIDEEQTTILSLSGYRGSSRVLGVVTEKTFRLQRRRYWRNDFAHKARGLIEAIQAAAKAGAHREIYPLP